MCFWTSTTRALAASAPEDTKTHTHAHAHTNTHTHTHTHTHSAPPAARRRVISTPPPQPGRCSLTLALARHPSPNAEQVYELFSRCGEVKRVVMGLDRYQKTPCGFCFVEFHHRESTEDALRLVSGCKLDERIIRVGEALAPGPWRVRIPFPSRAAAAVAHDARHARRPLRRLGRRVCRREAVRTGPLGWAGAHARLDPDPEPRA